ncbi:MAG: energy transducer TonB, partial [Chitinophagia bacterium]|nr:energy transducer TonB [Chitinophagia bacterium]
MDANKILGAELIDLIFEGRNKSYGAYELRTGYNKRLRNALLLTTAIALLILLASFISSLDLGNKKGQVVIKEVQLEEIKQEEPNEPPPPPPPKPPEPPKVEMAKFTPPKVVKDEEVKEDEKPPEIEKLEETKIGTVNQEGTKDEGIVAPPVEDKGGVVEAPKEDDSDKVFQKVEIDAEFPGGTSGWTRYVTREIERNIDDLQDDGRSGTVVILFIVDKEGAVSEVRALPCNEAGVGNCLPPNSKLAEI